MMKYITLGLILTCSFSIYGNESKPIQFSLKSGTLESNISRALQQNSDFNYLLWEVSKEHKIPVNAEISAKNIYKMIDRIITPYNQPKQIKAQFFKGNNVVRVYYSDEISKP